MIDNNNAESNGKVIELVRQIHARTAEGRIPWEQTVDDQTLLAAFPSYTVVLAEVPTPKNTLVYLGPYYDLRVNDERGKLAVEVTAQDMTMEGLQPLLSATFQLARRQAKGSEAAIDGLLHILENLGTSASMESDGMRFAR